MLKNLIILPDGTEVFSGNARDNAIISCEFSQFVNDGAEMSIGSACCNELEVKLFAKNLLINANDEIQYYKVSGNGNRTKIGVFHCEKPTVTGTGTYKFVAYDRVSWLDRDLTDWLSSLNGWPYKVKDFARMVCEACGLTLTTTTLPNGDYQIRKFSGSGVTGRMLMQWLGQITCRFIRANADGEIEFAWYSDKGKEITTRGEFAYFGGSLSYEDFKVAEIQKVQIQATDEDNGTVYPDGSEEELNTYKITGNYLLTAETGDELKPVAQAIYEQLQGVTYTPCKVSIQATTEINAGDIVRITDRNGVTITTYVMSKINKGQKDTLECTGSYKRDSSTATNTLTMKALNGKVLDIKKDVDGLRISNKDTAGRVAKLELSTTGITASVESVKKTSDEALEEAKRNATELTNYASQVNGSLTDLQNQIDGAIETWFYDYEPTASNAPASSWTTTEDKNKHLGDLFYIIDNEDKGGLVYRWALVNGVYGWILVEDTEVAKALETASQAKDTADGKRRVFVAQPKPPYDVGDLWTNNTDLYVCQTARAEGSYTASDWKLATEYTTEKAVNALIEVTEKNINLSVESVKKTVDGIAVGGRNLLKGTRDFSGFRVYPDGFISIEENGDFSNARFNEDIPEGAGLKYVTSSPNPINLAEVLDQEVVFSFEIASPDDFKSAGDDIIVEFAVCGAENTTRLRYKLFYLETDVPTAWKNHVIKAKLTEDFFSGGDGNFSDATRFWVRFYSNSGNILYARKFKLELGNMATDWSANPEETEKSIASLKITADGISSDVKNAKGDIYKLSVKADEQATLIESANGKATEALQKAGSIDQTYTWDDGGKLEIHIDGTGRCEAVYTNASGVEQSSARFDLAARVFRLNGDIVSKNDKSTFKVEDLGLTFSRSTDVGTEAYDHSSFKLALNEVLSKYYPSLFMGGRSYEDSSLYIRCYENGIWIGNLHVPTNVSRFDAPMDGGLGLFINTETGNVSLHTKETAKYAFEAVFA